MRVVIQRVVESNVAIAPQEGAERTQVIGQIGKGLMVLVGIEAADDDTDIAWLSKKIKPFGARLLGAVIAEIVMIGGYFVFEGFIYGFAPSLVNIPANAVQGVAGVIVGMMLITLFEKQNILKMLK